MHRMVSRECHVQATLLTSMTSLSKALQSSDSTVHPGLLSLKACAAGSSFSMAHIVSAVPD